MSIKKEIIETELRASGFKKVQENMVAMSKAVEEYRDEIKRLEHEKNKLIAADKKGTKEYRNITKEITENRNAMNAQIAEMKKQEKQVFLSEMSYNQLKKRASELTKQLYNMSEAADPKAFAEARGELKQYQDQMSKMQQGIKMTNAAFKNQKPTVWTNIKQLIPIASITAIGAKLTSVANQAIQTFTRLDDKMADVQKTTQMSKAEVKALDVELMKINTRTSREDLLDLARVAGKLGVAKNEVAGFVRATDQIRVALSEDLGGDVEESIQKIGKLTSIFHLREEMGLEKSLLSVGSAINSLGADSEANEGYLVDFTNRTAGVAPQAKVSIQNVLGLGASLDQLGQSAEVAGTTYSQVMTGMYKKTDKYAKIAGMSVSDFSKLLREDANEAFLKFLEGANKTGDMEAMTKNLATLKLEGTRSTQVLGALAGNVDMIRQQQALANVEFAKATSLTEEYNTKNASAQAMIEKRQKAIDQVIASLGEKLMPLWSETLGLTAGFMSILKALIGTLIEYRGVIIAVSTVTATLVAIKKLQHFYSRANRVAILEEVIAIKTGTLATAKATTGTYALAAAKALVTLQFRAAAVAAKAFFASLGPIGWVITAVSLLIPAIEGVKKGINAVREANQRLSKDQAKLNSELEIETSKINILFGRLNNAKKGTDEYVKAKKAILDQYGSYLEGMSKEIKSLDDVKGAYEAITRAARESVIERLRANQVEDAAQEAGESWEEALTNLDQNLQAAFKKGKEGLAKTLFPAIRDALNAENTTLLSDLEAGRLRVLKVLQDTYGKKGASKIYNRITGDIENYLRATDKFKTRQEEINRIYGADTLLLSSGDSSTTDIEGDEDGIGDDKKEKGKWSLTSDESYLKAKAELRERQIKGDIRTEEEYSRLLLALEIKTLEDRIAANKEKGADLAKLKSELAEKEYQQAKNEQARTEKLLAAARTPYEAEVADYEKRLKELGLFGIDREQMTEDQQRALLKLEKEHRDKLYNLWLDGLNKQEAKRKENNDAELRELRTQQNNELAAATTLEQKKAILRRWFSDIDLKRVTTDEQAQKIITAKYQEEEQQMLKKHLEQTIATYNMLLSGAINPLFALGLTPEMRAKIEAELKKLEESLSKVKRDMSEGDTTTTDTDKTKSKSNIDILGFSEDQWEDFFKKSESVSDSIGKWNMALQAVGNTFGMISDMMTAAENREFRKYEQTANRKKKVLERQLKSGTISQERYNESVQRIDEETEAKREEMERKQAKRQKVMSLFQALTNTAVAITAALPNIPLVAVVAAMGAIQAATILATPLPGFEQGGLIGVEREQDGKRFNAEFAPRRRGRVHRPTVIQTDSGQPVLTGEAGTEYVVPNHLLQVPQIASMVGMIESARLRGTFRPVNIQAAQAASGVIPGRAVGGYVGGSAPAPESTASSPAIAAIGYDDGVLRELKEVVGKLSRQLEKPIPTYISYLGKDGIATIQKKLEQQQRRAGIGGGK